MLRFKINKEKQVVQVVDTQTAQVVTPDCGHDMEAYHAYLEGISRGRPGRAQSILEEVAGGRHPITELKRCAESR